jgi:cell division protein FtsB
MRERLRRHRRPPRDGRGLAVRLRWAWLPLLLWWAYAALLGEHSLLGIWRLSQENRQVDRELVATRGELERLEKQLRDPRERRRMAERALRERSGWARPGEIVYRIPGAARDSLPR